MAPQYAIADVDPLVPEDRPAIPIGFCPADEHVEQIHKLREPSVIAVVSVSKAFLATARSLLAPAVGRRHALCEFLLPLENLQSLRGADIIFCDSIALGQVKSPRSVLCRLISPESLKYLLSASQAAAPAEWLATDRLQSHNQRLKS